MATTLPLEAMGPNGHSRLWKQRFKADAKEECNYPIRAWGPRRCTVQAEHRDVTGRPCKDARVSDINAGLAWATLAQKCSKQNVTMGNLKPQGCCEPGNAAGSKIKRLEIQPALASNLCHNKALELTQQ